MADIYDEIEDRIQTLIQGLAQFVDHPELVTRGDYRPLDTGIVEMVSLDPGGFGAETQEAYGSYRQWDVLVNIFVRYQASEADTHAAFLGLRSDVVNLQQQYPSLNNLGGVIETTISTDGDPDDVYDKANNGPFFTMQVLRWSVTRRMAISGGEYQ